MTNLLLIEDDADDRELFAEAVTLLDPAITINMKRDGENIIDYLSKQDQLPDMIFLDLNMPKKNGKECLWEIKTQEKLMKIPVIIYTTSLSPLDIEETFSMGASRFVRKPNTFTELKQMLQHILSEKTASSAERSRNGFVMKIH